MTAVIYARYSSDNQREESIEGQIRECTAYAEKNGITIVKHYIDRAISAKTDNRPQFQQMIKDSDKKLFDIVLVWKLDRFARNRYDSARYKTQLKKNGVKLMSATEIISEGPEGIILESVLEGYAEYYSADLAEKVVRGQTENILKGRCNGGRGTFGYTLDSERKFHIDPLTSPFVLESFKKYNEGSTMKEIRDWLNENGIKNPMGGAFTYNSVEHMLKNRRYIGELKFRDVVVPDAIPPIVPLELFEDVQEKIAKNKKAPARRKAEDDYLLTTKLFCGCCGALMFGESGTSRTGEVHRYCKCATAKKKKGCKKKTVRKQWLEDLVVNQTMQLVRDDAAMESIIAKVMELQDRENSNLPLYEKQLRDAESGIQNMLNAIQAGILTSSTKERLEQLEETKRELETRIAEETLAKPKIKEEFIRFWLLRFRKLDMSLKDQRQALVDTFINSIYLYDDKVLITFNYKEGTQTITFEEAAEAASKGNGSDLDCFIAPKNALHESVGRFFCCSILRRHDLVQRRRYSNRVAFLSPRALYFLRTVCYGITVHGLPTIFIYYQLLLCQLHHQFGFGGGDGKLEFILQVRLLQHIDDVVLHGGWLDAEFFCNLVIGQPAHKAAQDLHLSFGELGARGSADLHAGRCIGEDMLPRHRAAHDLHQGPFIAVLIPQAVHAHGFCACQDLCVNKRGRHHDLDFRVRFSYLFGGGQAVFAVFCLHIHQHKVDVLGIAQDGSLCSAGDGHSKLIPVLVLNIAFKQAPYQLLVLNDHNAYH